jgi:hypothetical protein
MEQFSQWYLQLNGYRTFMRLSHKALQIANTLKLVPLDSITASKRVNGSLMVIPIGACGTPQLKHRQR